MKTNIFKSLFKMAAVMAVFTILFSCDKDDVVDQFITIGLSDQPALDVDKRNLTFENGDNTEEVKVYYQEAWNYIVDEDWVHATREGNKLVVQVDDNRTKETRESRITIYATNDSDSKTYIKVSQSTSLITVSCSETELNFSAYEGAFNTLSVQSNGDWRIMNTPDWLRASVSSGNGNKTISFTTLSANKMSSSRTGTVVIATNDEEVSVPVMQYGEAMSNFRSPPRTSPSCLTALHSIWTIAVLAMWRTTIVATWRHPVLEA